MLHAAALAEIRRLQKRANEALTQGERQAVEAEWELLQARLDHMASALATSEVAGGGAAAM